MQVVGRKERKKEADVELCYVLGAGFETACCLKRKPWASQHHSFTCSMAISASIDLFFYYNNNLFVIKIEALRTCVM